MRTLLRLSPILFFIFLFCGCAQSYRLLSPTNIGYTASNNLEDIRLEYRYDILSESGNKKISKKEKKNNIKLVAVKITNNTDKIINIGNNAAFFNGNSKLYPMEPVFIKKIIKQSVPSHLFYLLLTPLTLSVNDSNPFPVGLILGPGIAGGNMIVAGNANKNFYRELVQYDILYRDIQPNETVFGLVAFHNLDYVPLTLRLIK